jgi:hypothetical protein
MQTPYKYKSLLSHTNTPYIQVDRIKPPRKPPRISSIHQIPSPRIDIPSEIPRDSNTYLRRNEDEDEEGHGDEDVDRDARGEVPEKQDNQFVE